MIINCIFIQPTESSPNLFVVSNKQESIPLALDFNRWLQLLPNGFDHFHRWKSWLFNKQFPRFANCSALHKALYVQIIKNLLCYMRADLHLVFDVGHYWLIDYPKTAIFCEKCSSTRKYCDGTFKIQIKTGKGWVTSNKIGQTNPPPHLSMVRDGLGSRGSRGSQICISSRLVGAKQIKHPVRYQCSKVIR